MTASDRNDTMSKATFDPHVAEKLLTRGNKLAALTAPVLARIAAGDVDEFDRDDLWDLSCQLRAWGADVRAIAGERRP